MHLELYTVDLIADVSNVVIDRDMGARHRARPCSIQIMKVQVIPAAKLRSKNLRQFVVSIYIVLHWCCSHRVT